MINININMVAERRARRMREMTIIRVSMLSVVAISVILVLTNLIAWYTHQQAKQKLADINNRLVTQEVEFQAWTELQDEIQGMLPVVELLEKVQMSEGAWMTILGDLSKITTQDVVITSLNSGATADGFLLRISGRAKDEKALANYMLRLREDTGWANVPKLNVTSVEESAETSNTSRFDLDVPVIGLIGGEI